MKQLLSFAFLALTAGSAFAADLPTRKEPLVPPPPPPPMWTGLYAGLNAGGTWSDNNSVNFGSVSLQPDLGHQIQAAIISESVPLGSRAGFIGGGQIGYNWQLNFGRQNFVIGLETDFEGILGAANGSLATAAQLGSVRGILNPNIFLNDYGYATQSAATSLGYLGTVRGRIGYLFTPSLLVYGTGGFAYGVANLSTNSSVVNTFETNSVVIPNGPVGFAASGRSYTTTLAGWTAGGGVEWMFAPNWSTKLEYLYYDLGNMSGTLVSPFTPTSTFGGPAHLDAATRYSTRFNGNIVRAGLNYHFNLGGAAPVVAKF